MSNCAFTISTVAANCSPKVECLASWRHLLLVGCVDGTLQVYQAATGESSQFELIKSISKFSKQKKSITQLLVVERWSILLCLTDTYICVHDLASFNFIRKLRTTRNSICFCVHEDSGLLCVSANKQLVLFKWDGTQFLDYNDLHLPSTARSIAFISPTILCVGFRREYNLLDISTGDVHRELIVTGKSEKPMLNVLELPQDWRSGNPKNSKKIEKELLVSKDSWGILFQTDGNPSRNTSEFVQWTGCPLACISAFPFLVSITDEFIEVHHVGTLKPYQKLNLSNAKSVVLSATSMGSPGISNSASLPSVFVATSNSLHLLTMVPLSTQVKQLEEAQLYSDAISLFTLCKRKMIALDYDGSEQVCQENLHSLRLRLVYSCFDNQQYSIALRHSKSGISDPMYIISLFPELLPGVFSTYKRNRGVENSAEDAAGVAGFVGFDKSAVSVLLIPYLNYLRKSWGAFANEKKEESRREKRSMLQKIGIKEDKTKFFEHNFVRDRAVKGDNSTLQLKEIVDTVLFTAFIRTNAKIDTIYSLLVDRTKISCDCKFDHMESLLMDMPEKWEELIWLYFSKGLHQKALEWLSETSTEKLRAPYPSLKVRAQTSTKYLYMLLEEIASRVSSKSRKDSLEEEIVHGLLIMEYFQWIYQHDPEMSVKLFSSLDLASSFGMHKQSAEKNNLQGIRCILCFFNIIDPLSILEHLKAQQTELRGGDSPNKPKISSSSVEERDSTCLQFLEFILIELPRACSKLAKAKENVWMSSGMELLRGSELHNRMIEYYLEEITLARRRVHMQGMDGDTPGLGDKQHYMRGPALPAVKEPGHSGSLRRRLLEFLSLSKKYQPEKLLSKFQLTNMLEERALLLRSAGRHEEALHIYVHELGDLVVAAKYCEEVHDLSTTSSRNNSPAGQKEARMGAARNNARREPNNVYVKLLRTCLTPSNKTTRKYGSGSTVGWAGGRNTALVKPALKILRSHRKHINAADALTMLPDSCAISQLLDYISSSVKDLASTRRRNQIVKNMLKLQQLNEMREQAKLKSQFVVIDRDTRCQKCGHTFTARSVPAVHPDRSVYHVACSIENEY